MAQQASGAPRVFGGDHGGLSQGLGGAGREISQIAERRGDDVQGSPGRPAPPPCGPAYARCCLIFPSSVALGTAPITVSTCCPFLKNRMLGIERTLNRMAVRWLLSTSTLATLARPAYSPASCSRTGATIWHGPHHVAQKSTSTSPSACSISLAKDASVTWTAGVFVAAMVLFSSD